MPDHPRWESSPLAGQRFQPRLEGRWPRSPSGAGL